jgi:predicted aspartyl protease
MTRLSNSFVRDRELILVEAEVVGPARWMEARLVLDTGAAATTLTPQVIEKVGYPT